VTFYRLYGRNLATDFRFRNRLIETDGPADLTFACETGPLPPFDPSTTCWPPNPQATEPLVSVQRGAGWTGLRFRSVSSFSFRGDSVHCRLGAPGRTDLVETQLLGLGMALWLELAGTLTFHASAVRTGDVAIAFVGWKGAGKTTMAAEFLARGAELITDDLLALDRGGGHPECLPGYPQLRLWPEEAQRFLGRTEGLPLVHPRFTKVRAPVGGSGFGAFCADAVPLAALVVLSPGGRRWQMNRIDDQCAVIELLRHSFAPEMVQSLGLSARRLPGLVSFSAQVPIYRLERPAGAAPADEAVELVAGLVGRTAVAPGR
jgi:hypothetical protein